MGNVDALNHLSGFTENHFLERQKINLIVETLAKAMYGLPGTRLKAFEPDAIAAVAACACTDGDLDLLAKQIAEKERWFSEDDLTLLRRASQKVLRNRDFANQLFNGDARPIIDKALEEVKKTIRY